MGNRIDKEVARMTDTPEYFREGRAFDLAISLDGIEHRAAVYVQHPADLETQIREQLYGVLPEVSDYTIAGEFDYRAFQRRALVQTLARDAVWGAYALRNEQTCDIEERI